jgi:predicted kinase
LKHTYADDTRTQVQGKVGHNQRRIFINSFGSFFVAKNNFSFYYHFIMGIVVKSFDELAGILEEKKIPGLLVMCGLPFSGKSVLAAKIAEHFGIEHINFYSQWVLLKTYKADVSSVEVQEYSIQLVEYFLEQRKAVVYDAINNELEVMEDLQCMADETGAVMTIIHMRISLEQLRKRRDFNKQYPTKQDVTDEQFLDQIAHFEPPDSDADNVIIIEDNFIM